jgi:hypothetical protein
MTAVEWLIEQLKVNNYISDNAHWLVQEAKEMEKQKLIEMHDKGFDFAMKEIVEPQKNKI